MNQKSDRETLSAALDDELSAGEQEVIDRALSDSTEAQLELQSYSQISSAIRSLEPISAPPMLIEQVMHLVNEASADDKSHFTQTESSLTSTNPSRNWIANFAGLIATAACIIVLVQMVDHPEKNGRRPELSNMTTRTESALAKNEQQNRPGSIDEANSHLLEKVANAEILATRPNNDSEPNDRNPPDTLEDSKDSKQGKTFELIAGQPIYFVEVTTDDVAGTLAALQKSFYEASVPEIDRGKGAFVQFGSDSPGRSSNENKLAAAKQVISQGQDVEVFVQATPEQLEVVLDRFRATRTVADFMQKRPEEIDQLARSDEEIRELFREKEIRLEDKVRKPTSPSKAMALADNTVADGAAEYPGIRDDSNRNAGLRRESKASPMVRRFAPQSGPSSGLSPRPAESITPSHPVNTPMPDAGQPRSTRSPHTSNDTIVDQTVTDLEPNGNLAFRSFHFVSPRTRKNRDQKMLVAGEKRSPIRDRNETFSKANEPMVKSDSAASFGGGNLKRLNSHSSQPQPPENSGQIVEDKFGEDEPGNKSTHKFDHQRHGDRMLRVVLIIRRDK